MANTMVAHCYIGPLDGQDFDVDDDVETLTAWHAQGGTMYTALYLIEKIIAGHALAIMANFEPATLEQLMDYAGVKGSPEHA